MGVEGSKGQRGRREEGACKGSVETEMHGEEGRERLASLLLRPRGLDQRIVQRP